ncbi:MAG: hypothetical protein IJD58_11320 [Lachnospiraceae bacterium]|nr:hypothetical protein [Lachnospiraceae bacterium]
MNIKPGDVYAQLGKVKRFHMFVFVKEYKGRMLFFDIHTGELFLLTYKTIEKALQTNTYHPVHRDLKMFDYVETLPDDVFEVVKADSEIKINEKEPEILDLF